MLHCEEKIKQVSLQWSSALLIKGRPRGQDFYSYFHSGYSLASFTCTEALTFSAADSSAVKGHCSPRDRF